MLSGLTIALSTYGDREGEALRAMLQRMKEERRAAMIFVNNRFEGNAPTTIEAITA